MQVRRLRVDIKRVRFVECSVSQTHDRTLIICFVDVHCHPCAEVQVGPDFKWFAILSSGTEVAPMIEPFENCRSPECKLMAGTELSNTAMSGDEWECNDIDATIEISLFEVCREAEVTALEARRGKSSAWTKCGQTAKKQDPQRKNRSWKLASRIQWTSEK